MKILQISSAQSLGGGERHLIDLADGLVSHGHEVDVVVRPNSPLIDQFRQVPRESIISLPLRNSLDAGSARQLAALVRRNEHQILHGHMARDYPLAAFATRRNSNAKLIVTRHVLFRLNSLHRITFSQTAQVIAVSQAVASQLLRDQVVPPQKISVVSNGIDASAFALARERLDRKQFLKAWKFPQGSVVVGIVGELSPLKGQVEFLQAAAKIADRFPNVYFIVAGTDHSAKNETRHELERLIEKSSLTDRVRLAGWLEDVTDVYAALDVFVSASHTESFGLAIAEAMAARTAVVATASEGAQEIIEPGKTGLLVEIGNVDGLAQAISELLSDESKRTEMAKAGQQSVMTRFSIERMIEETEKVYREALSL